MFDAGLSLLCFQAAHAILEACGLSSSNRTIQLESAVGCRGSSSFASLLRRGAAAEGANAHKYCRERREDLTALRARLPETAEVGVLLC